MGIKIGLIICLYLVFIYLYKYISKEDLKSAFEACNDKNKVYVYWTRSSKNTKYQIPIYINDIEVEHCKYKKVVEINKPSNECVLTIISNNNTNKVYVNEKELFHIVVDSTGKCERYTYDR